MDGYPGPAVVLKASSTARSAERAVAEIRAEMGGIELGCLVFFCSPEHDLGAVARALTDAFPDTLVVGCSTAGEITPDGYGRGSLTAIGLPRRHFSAVAAPIRNLSAFDLQEGHPLVTEARARLERKADMPSAGQSFAFLLIDGLSRREEWVVSALSMALDDIPLFGGSAGDQLRFSRTFVYFDGAFHADAAVLLLVATRCPFTVFRTEHFVSTDRKMVVTGAEPTARIVTEINGEPAGREYARMVGLDVSRLTPMIFATYPVVVRIGGVYYVRAIQKVNRDESLTFFCAIDEGIVLTVAQGMDIVDSLEATLAGLRDEIGPPQVIIGCDCILRRLEVERKRLVAPISALLAANNVVGFNTYGEQHNAMHVNQTLTGVAIGAPRGLGS
ncbi:MAG: FIST domain containing protein [Alphaproteobacteria bacterium]|nr:FIST domain containing protein [Alphaproteobacteria bacterium]